MRILFLLAYYYPETAASIYLFDNIIDALIESGYDVELVCPIPGRGVEKSINKLYRKRLFENTKGGHLNIHRYVMRMEGKGTLSRFWRYVICCAKTYVMSARIKNVDVVFSESTPPILGLTAALIKKRKNIPLIYNLQDVFPDSLVLTGICKKNSLAWKLGRLIENITYKNSDKIITISQDFYQNISNKLVPEAKINVVYNWVDENAVVDIPRDKNKLFDTYGLNRSDFFVTYCGNIGLSQNMDMLLDVADELRFIAPSIQFVLVGNGAYIDNVIEIIAAKRLDNVHLLPFQPYEEISNVFSLGDVSLVISKPGTGNGCVPSKTWSIMSASRPVLANFDPNELKSIIECNNCGLFTLAGDKDAFKNSLLRLYRNPALCKEYGKNGRKFIVENLTRDIGTTKYIEVINSMI